MATESVSESTDRAAHFPLLTTPISPQSADPTLDDLFTRLEDLFTSRQKQPQPGTLAARVQCEAIVERVAESLYVERDQILGTSRTQHLAFTRQVAIYLCRKLTGLSFPKLGEYFHRDHSSVIHACNVIQRRVDDPARGPAFGKLIARIEEQVTSDVPATTEVAA